MMIYTEGGVVFFFEPREKPYSNADFTFPYCARLRRRILHSAQLVDQSCVDGGVYAATQGPRLDSIAEINRYERDGADMVGMTGMPEAALAKELDLSYAAIAVVANYAGGRGDSADGINIEKVNATNAASTDRVRSILECVVNCDGG